MIDITGYLDPIYDEVTKGITDAMVREAENSKYFARFVDDDEVVRITEKMWDEYASEFDSVSGKQAAKFQAPYDTYDEMLDSYREAQWSNYEESRIG